MSTVYADTLEPTVPTKNTTLGATGDSITIGGDSINTNVIQDSGGNVLFQSDGSGTLSNVNSAFAANLKLLSTQTASNSASISFTSGIDSTYDVYMFTFTDINPATNNVKFTFNGSDDTSSWSYDVVKTTTYYDAQHAETGASGAIYYKANHDLAQSTAYQPLGYEVGSDADQSLVGTLYLFQPSSTTYVKHFYYTGNYYAEWDGNLNPYVAGYFNTTSAITAIDFKMDSGNFDGIIKMYGL